MRIKHLICAFALSCSIAPAVSFSADLDVTNNTDSYGTGYFSYSPCSSVLGERGVIQPHQTNFTVPNKIITMFCGTSDCEAQVFASKDCSGSKAATVTVNANKGIMKIVIHDKKYSVTGSGWHITINSASKGMFNWFKSLFTA